MTNPSQVVFEDSDDKERNPTVRKILSNVAGVSEDTYSKGKKILDSDNKELKQEVLSGEKSINAGYKELTQGKNKKTNENEKLTTWLEGLKNDKNEEVMQWMLDIQFLYKELLSLKSIDLFMKGKQKKDKLNIMAINMIRKVDLREIYHKSKIAKNVILQQIKYFLA